MKDDNINLLNNTKENFQDKLLERVLDSGKNDDENIANVLSLNTELHEKQ